MEQQRRINEANISLLNNDFNRKLKSKEAIILSEAERARKLIEIDESDKLNALERVKNSKSVTDLRGRVLNELENENELLLVHILFY